MTPYYEDDMVAIYHGDCREIMPGLSYDVIVTDPPYGTGHYETDTAVLTPDMARQWVDAGPVAIFGYPERMVELCVSAGITPSEWVTWWASNAACKGFNVSGLWKETEVVAIFGEHRMAGVRIARSGKSQGIATTNYEGPTTRLVGNERTVKTRRAGDVWIDAAPGLAFNAKHRKHPNEKPVALMSRLISGMPPGVILDPFVGSGTTLVAARDAGRRCIGIELVEAHCETAASRFTQGVLAL